MVRDRKNAMSKFEWRPEKPKPWPEKPKTEKKPDTRKRAEPMVPKPVKVRKRVKTSAERLGVPLAKESWSAAENRMTRLISVCAVSILTIFTWATFAHAFTLDAFCQWDETERAVLSLAKEMKFPADAKGLKPSIITFIESAGSGQQPPMSCVYSLTYSNYYDFGNFRAIIEEVGPNELKVKRLESID